MRYYFIDSEIYFQGKKEPPRKVELFAVDFEKDGTVTGYDENGNQYTLEAKEVFTEDEQS